MSTSRSDLSGRFELLDALRGLCALAVVALHTSFLTGVQIAASAYLAVDIFFMMSGFVIAHAYNDKLLRDGYFVTFIKKRYARFLPMWIIGMLIGAMAAFPSAYHDGAIAKLAGTVGLGLLIIPTPWNEVLFPLNLPGWSLLAELVVNVCYAIVVRWLNSRVLLSILAVSLALVALAAVQHGNINTGPMWSSAPAGLARSVFGFTAGVLIYRLGVQRRARLIRGNWAIIAFAVITVILFVPVDGAWRPWFDLTCVAIIFPATLIGLVGHGRSWSWCEELGAISYPLYAVHFSIFLLARTLLGLATGWRQQYFAMPVAFFLCMVVVGFAFLLGRFVDPMCQRMVGAWLHMRSVNIPHPS